MPPIPRYRPQTGPAIFSAGFRPFFLAAAAWSALAVPLWLAAYLTSIDVPTLLPPVVWHVHEMVYGFAAATVAGFLLTAIPNWTGRMPLQGWPLAALVLLWAGGRFAVLFSSATGAVVAAPPPISPFPQRFSPWSRARSWPAGTGAICRCSGPCRCCLSAICSSISRCWA